MMRRGIHIVLNGLLVGAAGGVTLAPYPYDMIGCQLIAIGLIANSMALTHHAFVRGMQQY